MHQFWRLHLAEEARETRNVIILLGQSTLQSVSGTTHFLHPLQKKK